MLPRSGALQLKIGWAQVTRDMVSMIGAISRFESPGLQGSYSLGRKKFQRPCSRALAFSSFTKGGRLPEVRLVGDELLVLVLAREDVFVHERLEAFTDLDDAFAGLESHGFSCCRYSAGAKRAAASALS